MNPMFRSLRPAALSLLGLMGVCGAFACGEDEPAPPPGYLTDPGAPLALETPLRGLPVLAEDSLQTARQAFGQDIGRAGHLVIQLQIFDQLHFFRTNSAGESVLDRRLDALMGGPVGELIRASDVPITLTVDLQRLDRQWLVDWRGLDRDAPGVRETSFTFQARDQRNQGDYQTDMLASLGRALNLMAADGRLPARVVLGLEMDRHYLAAPQDWPSVQRFVQAAVAQVRTEHPGVQVGVGINLAHFHERVMPAFLQEGEVAPSFAAAQRAWYQVVDSLYYGPETAAALQAGERVQPQAQLDFLALSVVPDGALYQQAPESVPDTLFSTLTSLYAAEPWRASLPVAFVAVGWPVGQNALERSGLFLQRLLAWLNPDLHDNAPSTLLVNWWGYNHLLDNECAAVTSARVAAPSAWCFRGLYTTIPAITGSNRLVDTYFNLR
jgi:hypothetical protein